jgi:hypothetical protein
MGTHGVSAYNLRPLPQPGLLTPLHTGSTTTIQLRKINSSNPNNSRPLHQVSGRMLSHNMPQHNSPNGSKPQLTSTPSSRSANTTAPSCHKHQTAWGDKTNLTRNSRPLPQPGLLTPLHTSSTNII